jgi:predicted amidohydrolase YtcJ
MIRPAIAIAIAIASLVLVPGVAGAQAPDVILYGGKVSTLASGTAQAIAIRDGKVLATGSDGTVRRLAGHGTRLIDLGGRRVLPGLIDGHLHGLRTAYHCWTQTVRLDPITARSEALAAYRDRAAKLAPGRWLVTTGGWSLKQLDEPRDFSFAELSAAAPANPVWSTGADVAGPRVNAAALAALELKPGDPGVELDVAGQPSGRLVAPATERASRAILAQFDTHGIDGEAQCLADFIDDALAHGLTAWSDAGGNTNPWSNKGAITDGLHAQEAGNWLHRTGRLKARIAFHDMSSYQGPARAIQNMENVLGFLGDDRFRLLGPGEDTMGEDPGFADYTKLAASRRLSVESHLSDSNHDQVLAGFEAANQVYPIAGLNWRLAHPRGGTPSDQQLQRAKAIGAGYIFTFTPLWRGGEPPRYRAALQSGVRLCLGSDAGNVAPWQPFQDLWMATTGHVLVPGARGIAPADLLSREEALALATRDCAWALGLEGKIGVLEAGAYADLIVLDKDYFDVSPDEIRTIRPLLTMVEGKIVYARSPYKP